MDFTNDIAGAFCLHGGIFWVYLTVLSNGKYFPKCTKHLEFKTSSDYDVYLFNNFY